MIVPEAATLLFAGGFPRSSEVHARRAAQRAIYHVQRNLEDVQSARFPDRILLCDRGTADGAAYWPGDPAAFFGAVGSTLAAELARYDAVIFFETAAAGGISIEGGNQTRNESLDEALAIDRRLQTIWSRHPRFVIVRHSASFMSKVVEGVAALQKIVADLKA